MFSVSVCDLDVTAVSVPRSLPRLRDHKAGRALAAALHTVTGESGGDLPVLGLCHAKCPEESHWTADRATRFQFNLFYI